MIHALPARPRGALSLSGRFAAFRGSRAKKRAKERGSLTGRHSGGLASPDRWAIRRTTHRPRSWWWTSRTTSRIPMAGCTSGVARTSSPRSTPRSRRRVRPAPSSCTRPTGIRRRPRTSPRTAGSGRTIASWTPGARSSTPTSTSTVRSSGRARTARTGTRGSRCGIRRRGRRSRPSSPSSSAGEASPAWSSAGSRPTTA